MPPASPLETKGQGGGGPPPRSLLCAAAAGARSEGEEEVADLVDDLRVTGRRPPWEASESGQHEVRRAAIPEDRVAALEVALLGLGVPGAVLARGPPFATPRP